MSDTLDNFDLASKGGRLLQNQILRVEIGQTYIGRDIRSLNCERGLSNRAELLYRRSLELVLHLRGSFEVNLDFKGPLTESDLDLFESLYISIENIATESPLMPRPRVMIFGEPDNKIQKYIRGLSRTFVQDCTWVDWEL